MDGARDADGDVKFGLDGLAGLADLFGVGAPTGVDDGAGGSDGSPELVGEGFYVLGEAFGAADARPPETTISASVSPTRELRSTVLPVT